MFSRRIVGIGLVVGLAAGSAVAQDSSRRKYKAPPETSHIEVLVLKDANQKPILNAAVVFHSVKDGKDEGNLEVKTNEQGKASIDVIPTGSSVDVQVIADGFATWAQTYVVDEPSRSIEVRMLKPRAQISTYTTDNRGQPAQRPAGVQEPNKPGSAPNVQTLKSPNDTSDPSALAPGAVNDNPKKTTPAIQPGVPLQTNPPNMHPDNQYPMDPATAPKPPSQSPTAPPPPQD
jgi:hypothetical protein